MRLTVYRSGDSGSSLYEYIVAVVDSRSAIYAVSSLFRNERVTLFRLDSDRTTYVRLHDRRGEKRGLQFNFAPSISSSNAQDVLSF